MTAPDSWVQLYHPGLEASHRSTVDAYEAVWQYNGWVKLDDVARAAAGKVLADPVSASYAELSLVLSRIGIQTEGKDREQMEADAKVAAHHVGSDTPTGRALSSLGVNAPPAPAAKKAAAPKSTSKDGE